MSKAIVIEKVGDLFQGKAELARLGVHWATSRPMERSELVRELLRLGFHATDIGDALFAADPTYLANDSTV